MNCLIIDGWNLFGYNGIQNDNNYKKTVAVKQLGEDCAEIMWDVKSMTFEFVKNGNTFAVNIQRFSSAIKIADEWFKNMEESYE